MDLPQLDDRYRAVAPLGSGAQGSVWRASDADVPGRFVAVKLLAPGGQARLLRRELAVLGDLRHPGLAAVFDLRVAKDGRPFLVSELIEGETFDLFRSHAPREMVLEALACLLGTLDFLHRRELVHRDIKPDNLLVVPAAEHQPLRLKLVDFGLVAAFGQSGDTSGTLAYIAPEVLAGEAAGARADLYAVGVLLFSTLFGRLPFARPGEQLLADAELPPAAVPAELRELCRALLARQPAERPATAADALFALEGPAGLGAGRVERFLAGQGLPTPALVARDVRLEPLLSALEALRADGRGSAFALCGAAGSGRSRMLAELRREARLAGVSVWTELRAAGEPASAATRDVAAERAAAIDALLRGVIEAAQKPLVLLLDDVVDPLHQAVLRGLLALELPVLLCVVWEADGPPPPGFEQLALPPLEVDELSQLVASMIPHAWFSQQLVAVLQSYSGGNPRLATELLRVAAAARVSEGPGAVPDLSRFLEEDGQGAGAAVAERRVATLDADQAQAAAFVALFADGCPLASMAAQTRISSSALDALVLQGLVAFDDGRVLLQARSLAQPLLSALPAPQRGDLVQFALGLLPSEAVEQRAYVLVHGDCAAQDPSSVLGGARAARRRGALGRAARCYQAALPHLPATSRGEALRELAALRQTLGQHGTAVALLRGELANAAADTRCELACLAADAELRAGAVARGLELLGEHTPQGDAAAARWAAARGKLLLFAGRYAEALEAIDGLSAGVDEALQAEVAHTCGLAAFYLGHFDEAEAALHTAVELGAQDPLLLARATNSLGLLQQRRSDFKGARDSYERCVQLARDLGHLPFEASFSMNLASVAQQQGDLGAALAAYRQSRELARRFAGTRELAQIEHNLARLCAQLGRYDEADAHARSAEAGVGGVALVAVNAIVQAEIALDRGRLELAALRLDDARGALAASGDAVASCDAILVEGRLTLARGEAEQAAELARGLLGAADAIDSQRIQAGLLAGRAELARDGGDARRARQTLQEALRLAEETRELEPLTELHHQLARAAEMLGDPKEAALADAAARGLLAERLTHLPPELRDDYRRAAGRAAIVLTPQGSSGAKSSAATEGLAVARRQVGVLDAELLAALLEINKELNAEPDLQRLLERIIDHAVELTGAERGFLLLADPDGGALRIRVARNIDQETIRKKEFKISRSIAEEVLASGRSTITLDAMHDDRFREQVSVHQLRLRSVLCVPLSIHRQVRGAIYLDNRFATEAFGAAQQQLIGALADQAALALGHWELLEQNRQRQRELERNRAELEDKSAQLAAAMEQQSQRLAELADLARSQRDELEERYRFENLVGRSEPMRQLFALLARVKETDAAVLIQGESGTGKEVVARALHYAGARRQGPFVGVNCGAIPQTLLESELFGSVRGAFTGAERDRRGLFERADHGTLFLDEVGDMPPELQVKLLRVLQERRFCPVGSEEERASDFRLVAASNKDLTELVTKGEFREDLYYRVNVIRLDLPPLRERRDDIPLLLEALFARHGSVDVRLSRAALDRLLEYRWPGNVRELENEVLRLLALGGPLVEEDDLSPRLRPTRQRPRAPRTGTLKEALAQVELELVRARLAESGGNVTEAAKRLGMTRVGLHKLLKRHGLSSRDLA